MKNIDFSNRFHLVSPEQLRDYLVFGSAPFVPEGSDEYCALRPIIFSQEANTDDYGTHWKMDFSASVASSVVMKHNKTRAYVIFHMSDGSIRLLGNHQEAPLITVTPHAGAFIIAASIDCSAPIGL